MGKIIVYDRIKEKRWKTENIIELDWRFILTISLAGSHTT